MSRHRIHRGSASLKRRLAPLFRPPSGQPRVVQIHVCDAGGTWERDHIVFRDHLRAHPEVAAAYGRLKLELAAKWKDDRYAYTDAKTAFILDVERRV